jgi:hypothetical protein
LRRIIMKPLIYLVFEVHLREPLNLYRKLRESLLLSGLINFIS